MPIWLMLVPGILQGIAQIFHKDDPNNPTVQPSQAPQMFFQQMMPFLMLMGNKDSDNSMLPLLMMMSGGLTGANPIQSMDTTMQQIKAIQDQMTQMQEMMESLKKTK